VEERTSDSKKKPTVMLPWGKLILLFEEVSSLFERSCNSVILCGSRLMFEQKKSSKRIKALKEKQKTMRS
jgi:hypothetical protein